MGVDIQEFINRTGRRPGQSVGNSSFGSIRSAAVNGSGAYFEAKLTGFDELAAKLREIPEALRRRVLRNALAAGARLVRDEAKRSAPVLHNPMKAPYRTPGTLKGAIRVRTSKVARRRGDVGVFVNVRPAPGAKYKTVATNLLGLKGMGLKSRVKVKDSQRGAKSKTDPFYWRFVEFGTTKMRPRPFLKEGAKRLPDALRVFTEQVGKWFARTNASGKVAP